MLEVVEPGFLATVQDGGRPGGAMLGVPSGGACDRRSLAIANWLAGNDALAPALEIAVAGPRLVATTPTVVSLAGADLGAWLPDEGRALRPNAAHFVRAGSSIVFEPNRRRGWGCRSYLALAGGIDVPRVLGSASTYLPGRFGGIDGRSLVAADRLAGGREGDLTAAGRRWPEAARVAPMLPAPPDGRPAFVLHVLAGPHAAWLDGGLDALCARSLEVGSESDRIGLRLAGASVSLREAGLRTDEFVSIPLPTGAIQLPPDGGPVLLLADHQTVGGYPVPAVVARVDLPIAGQLAPGDRVRVVPTTVAAAQRAWRDDREAMRDALRVFQAGDAWAELAALTAG